MLKKYRFYCPNINTGLVDLNTDESHHLRSILRLNKGQQIEVFDGRGSYSEAVIEEISKKTVIVNIGNITNKPQHFPHINIVVSIPKKDRFEWLIEKCTELGADQIWPVICERTVKTANPKTMDRYRKIAIGAAKQSEGYFIPEIHNPEKFTDILEKIKTDSSSTSVFYGGFSNQAIHAKNLINNFEINKTEIFIFIGPEGGFCENELDFLHNLNAVEISINRNVLRIETAALAFTSLLCAIRDTLSRQA